MSLPPPRTAPPAGARLARIIASAEAFFGEPVLHATAPGGAGRASLRLHFATREVIATLRPNFRRTHLEAFVLRALAAEGDDSPACLGVDGDILFQADVGQRRLNVEIAAADPGRQADLADQAVAAIFRLHAAGRRAGLEHHLPALGTHPAWIREMVGAARHLQRYSAAPLHPIDAEALCAALAVPPAQFVKWDCRAGNAAIGADQRLRWFDFEYAGLRHGAEDFAWLIGDEAWPLAPGLMADIVQANFDPACGHARAGWMAYLALYLTFHTLQRLMLIRHDAARHGWRPKALLRRKDDVGAHPDFAAHLCAVGAAFAARNRLTEALVPGFEAAEHVFRSQSPPPPA